MELNKLNKRNVNKVLQEMEEQEKKTQELIETVTKMAYESDEFGNVLNELLEDNDFETRKSKLNDK